MRTSSKYSDKIIHRMLSCLNREGEREIRGRVAMKTRTWQALHVFISRHVIACTAGPCTLSSVLSLVAAQLFSLVL